MRFFGALAVAAAALALAGCPNPNDIGVQTYGYVSVKTIDANTGQPVAGVLVSAGANYTCTTVSTGMCQSALKLPVGKWTLIASGLGLNGTADVTVAENAQISVTIQMAP